MLQRDDPAHGREQRRRRRRPAPDLRRAPPRELRRPRPRRAAVPVDGHRAPRRRLRGPRRGPDARPRRHGGLLQAARQDARGLHGRRLVQVRRRRRLAPRRHARDRRPRGRRVSRGTDRARGTGSPLSSKKTESPPRPQEPHQAQGRRVHRHREHGEGVRDVAVGAKKGAGGPLDVGRLDTSDARETRVARFEFAPRDGRSSRKL